MSDEVNIRHCCGGHEVCFDHCYRNETWDEEEYDLVPYWD